MECRIRGRLHKTSNSWKVKKCSFFKDEEASNWTLYKDKKGQLLNLLLLLYVLDTLATCGRSYCQYFWASLVATSWIKKDDVELRSHQAYQFQCWVNSTNSILGHTPAWSEVCAARIRRQSSHVWTFVLSLQCVNQSMNHLWTCDVQWRVESTSTSIHPSISFLFGDNGVSRVHPGYFWVNKSPVCCRAHEAGAITPVPPGGELAVRQRVAAALGRPPARVSWSLWYFSYFHWDKHCKWDLDRHSSM